jgi:hypothetical protein
MTAISNRDSTEPCGCTLRASAVLEGDALVSLTAVVVRYCRRHRGRVYLRGEAPHSGGETSRAAALRQSGHLGRKELFVMLALREMPDHAEGVADRKGLLRLTAGARLSVLSRCEVPMVRDTGRRKPLKSGNPGIVWELTPAGRAALEPRGTP